MEETQSRPQSSLHPFHYIPLVKSKHLTTQNCRGRWGNVALLWPQKEMEMDFGQQLLVIKHPFNPGTPPLFRKCNPKSLSHCIQLKFQKVPRRCQNKLTSPPHRSYLKWKSRFRITPIKIPFWKKRLERYVVITGPQRLWRLASQGWWRPCPGFEMFLSKVLILLSGVNFLLFSTALGPMTLSTSLK